MLFFVILGLGSGGAYALLACGLIVAHQGSGVINFAHGAVATYTAYVFNGLRTDGVLRLPLFDFLPTHWLNVPTHVRLAAGRMNFSLAVAVSLAFAVVIALVSYALVFRPLRNAALLARVVGAVGVLIYLQAIVIVQYGTGPRSPENVLPRSSVTNFLGTGRSMPLDRLWIAFIGILAAVALALFFRHARLGLVTRALAENEMAGTLLGYSQQRVAAVSWSITGVLAGLVGVLYAPITGMDPSRFTLLLVPALSASLLARFSRPLLAAGAALVLGMFEGAVSRIATFSWFPSGLQRGITQVIPLVVILFVLFLRSDALPRRGAVVERALPSVPHPLRTGRFVFGIAALALLGAWRFTGPRSVSLTTSVIGVVLMLSLVVVVGYVGQLSLAQLAIAGMSAFALMRLMSNGTSVDANPLIVSGPGLPFIVAAPLAVIAGTAGGVLVGLPALRIRGVQLAVATIALALTVQEFVLKSPTLIGEGAGKTSPVPRPRIGSLDLGARDLKTGLTDRFSFAAVAIAAAAILMVVVARMRDSVVGRQLIAVRSNERAAAALGLNVARTKVNAIALASSIASIGGVLLAMQRGGLEANQFDFFVGLLILAFAYIGGITSVWGALLGGLIMGGGLMDYFIKLQIPGFAKYNSVLGGLVLTMNAVLNPAGIAASMRQTASAFSKAIRSRVAPRRPLRTSVLSPAMTTMPEQGARS